MIYDDFATFGAEQTIDYSSLKPTLQISHPVLYRRKQVMDSLELWVDSGAQVGQWSDVASTPVTGGYDKSSKIKL